MSKRNFVCFECRVAVRREAYSGEPVLCPTCGVLSHNIGYKIPVPPKSKQEAWDKLHLVIGIWNILTRSLVVLLMMVLVAGRKTLVDLKKTKRVVSIPNIFIIVII